MSVRSSLKTEHTGHKGSTRKHGFWGPRALAKYQSRKKRRELDKRAAEVAG